MVAHRLWGIVIAAAAEAVPNNIKSLVFLVAYDEPPAPLATPVSLTTVHFGKFDKTYILPPSTRSSALPTKARWSPALRCATNIPCLPATRCFSPIQLAWPRGSRQRLDKDPKIRAQARVERLGGLLAPSSLG